MGEGTWPGLQIWPGPRAGPQHQLCWCRTSLVWFWGWDYLSMFQNDRQMAKWSDSNCAIFQHFSFPQGGIWFRFLIVSANASHPYHSSPSTPWFLFRISSIPHLRQFPAEHGSICKTWCWRGFQHFHETLSPGQKIFLPSASPLSLAVPFIRARFSSTQWFQCLPWIVPRWEANLERLWNSKGLSYTLSQVQLLLPLPSSLMHGACCMLHAH